jgi:hypothetical protein
MAHGGFAATGDENDLERDYAAGQPGARQETGFRLVRECPTVNVARTLVSCAWHNGLSPPPRGGEHGKESQ